MFQVLSDSLAVKNSTVWAFKHTDLFVILLCFIFVQHVLYSSEETF